MLLNKRAMKHRYSLEINLMEYIHTLYVESLKEGKSRIIIIRQETTKPKL